LLIDKQKTIAVSSNVNKRTWIAQTSANAVHPTQHSYTIIVKEIPPKFPKPRSRSITQSLLSPKVKIFWKIGQHLPKLWAIK